MGVIMSKTQKPFSSIDIHQIGTNFLVSGVLYSNGQEDWLIRLPDENQDAHVTELIASDQDWVDLLRQSDLMETEILAKDSSGKLIKAIVRKSQRNVEQGVSWKVYKRDNYTCRYCGNNSVPLTVDHAPIPWESGGPSIEDNMVACCKRCNKMKSNMPYEEWLNNEYYEKVSKKLPESVKQANISLINKISVIPLKIHVASR